MLSKTSYAYKKVRSDLGCEGLDVNIPRGYYECDDRSRRYDKVSNNIRLYNILLKSIGFPAVYRSYHLTQRINTYTMHPRTTRSNCSQDMHGRAFFIVCTGPCDSGSINIIGGIRVLYVYGGLCLQQKEHYHYVIVTEFPVRPKDIHLSTCYAYNVTVVSTCVDTCRRYIDAQLINNAYEYKRNGVSELYLEWHGVMSDANENTRRLHNYTFEGGLLKVIKFISTHITIERTPQMCTTDSTPMSMPFLTRIRYNVFNSKYECYDRRGHHVEYRGQPMLGMYMLRGHRISQRVLLECFPQAQYLLLVDPSHTYF